MRVEGDLLLLTSGRIDGGVRVKVATLSVEMLESDGRAESDVSVGVGHAMTVERVLKSAAHEGIAFTAAVKQAEMDGKGQR